MENNIYFVTGIDTDAGKSYATGVIAHTWQQEGKRVITQKLIQTGNIDDSEDIALHRKIMGIPYTPEDKSMLTMPEIFSYPASPHLASQIDDRPINFAKIENATLELSRRYDKVLIEGAGGLMVPLTKELFIIDYIAQKKYPVILVTSGRLGSINHTLLSLEAIKARSIPLYMVAYNLFPETGDKIIKNDTREYLIEYIQKHFPQTKFIDIPIIHKLTPLSID